MFEIFISFAIPTLLVFATKIITSADDFIWLPKFLNSNSIKNQFEYLSALIIIVLIAFVVNILGKKIPQEKYLPLFASITLIIFAFTYLRKSKSTFNEKKKNSAFLISFFGSFDELVIFISFFSSDFFSFSNVIIGTFLAGLVIIFICNSLNQLPLFIKKINKLENWVIIAALGFLNLFISIYNLL